MIVFPRGTRAAARLTGNTQPCYAPGPNEVIVGDRAVGQCRMPSIVAGHIDNAGAGPLVKKLPPLFVTSRFEATVQFFNVSKPLL